MINPDAHARWLSHRKQTYIAFCIICFGLGFEYSLIFPSLWYYMSEVINTKYAKLFDGVALSAYPASSIIGAFTIARYADYSKRTRLVILILLCCEVVGNVLYAIDYSPLFPVAGRLIAGFGDVANMVMVGEVARSYETCEITPKISGMVMFFSVGFTLSPGMNIVFKLFDFHIGPIHMVYANMPGLFMAVVFAIIMVFAYFMVSDISRDYDLKGAKEKSKLSGEVGYRSTKYGSDNSDHETVCLIDAKDTNVQVKKEKSTIRKRKKHNVLKSIFSSFDLTLLLAFGFVCSYTLFGFDTLMALIASTYFNFDVTHTSLIFIIDGMLYGLLLIALAKVSAFYKDFHIIAFAAFVLLFGLIAILSLKVYHSNIYFSYACLIAYILAFSTTWSIEEVLTRSLFGKLVPSSCQSYAEGIRRSVSSVAFIISGISTAGLFDYLAIICSVLIVLTLILLVVFIHRKDTLANPVPQFYAPEEEEESLLPS